MTSSSSSSKNILPLYLLYFFFLLSYLLPCYLSLDSSTTTSTSSSSSSIISNYEDKVIKGNRNALYWIRNGQRHLFPDFNTFKQRGFTINMIEKVSDHILSSIPLGDPLPSIPIYRPDDYMYHTQCEDPDRIVNDLGVIPNLGDLIRFWTIYQKISKRQRMEILFLGGSITAGGYFMSFIQELQQHSHYQVQYYNHGHGATDIPYTIYCIDIEKYQPDVIFIDFAVNDYGHPKQMDALIRKALSLPSQPLVVLMDLWVTQHCPPARYLLHAQYYQLPLINVCPVVDLCYGKGHLPKEVTNRYSETDGVHPWGKDGVSFLGGIMYAWWKRLISISSQDVSLQTDGKMLYNQSRSFDLIIPSRPSLPPPLYAHHPIGLCTSCAALAEDADSKLLPIHPPKGFRVITRAKMGFGGFKSDSSSATKSTRRSWQANEVGAEISFSFYGSTVSVAIWQRRDGMGVLHAFIDGDESHIAKASGFFKGYTWAMERNNTGRTEIVPLFEGLSDRRHNITFRVSNQPANPWVKGHLVQILALLSASDYRDCRL